MKSKTSCFNKAIFHKNLTLYWPIWVSNLIIMLGMLPLLMELNFYNFRMWSDIDLKAYKVRYMLDVINSNAFSVVIFGFAVIYAMALFGYLFNSKSANMIHSLPVTRGELFGTNFISGLLFMIVPEVIAFILGVLVCIYNGVTEVQYLGIWLLFIIMITLLFYSMATICCFLTGQLLAVPVYYLVLNFWYPALQVFVSWFIAFNGYGLSSGSVRGQMNCPFLCPLDMLFGDVGFHGIYSDEIIQFQGWGYLIAYDLIAAVFVVLSIILYKNRAIECAQDLLSFQFLKPIFRWGVGFVAGFASSIILQTIFASFNIQVRLITNILLTFSFTIIFFFLSEMLIEKSFRVFGKKRLKECAFYLVFITVCFVGVRIGTGIVEDQKYDKDEIKYAFLRCEDSKLYGYHNMDDILEIHQMLLDNKSDFRYYENLDLYASGCYNLSLNYTLKNGKIFSRSYNIPCNEKGMEIVHKVQSVTNETETFLETTFSVSIGHATKFREGRLETYSLGLSNSVELSEEETEKLYNACIADAKAGVLAKYNGYSDKADGSQGIYETIHMEYLFETIDVLQFEENSSETRGYWSLVESHEDGIHIYDVGTELSFGLDCENIINTLIECGAIQSKDDLHLMVEDE